MKKMRKYSYYLITILLILAVSLIAASIYVKWTRAYYFGKILNTQENSITIRTKKNEVKQVLITSETRIKEGWKDTQEKLTQGKDVIVVGKINLNGEIDAQMVRIVKPHVPKK